MTLPIELTRAVLNTQARILVLREYICGKSESEFVKVPRDLVRQLVMGLKHYPSKFELNESANALPGIWGRYHDSDDIYEMEPVRQWSPRDGDRRRTEFSPHERPILRCQRCGYAEYEKGEQK